MEPIIQLKEVHYRYRDDRTALHRVSFDIITNRKTAIVGSNGAGKSTIVFHMNGLFVPAAGEIVYKGQAISKRNRDRMVEQVGIVFQDPDDQIISLTVFEDVAFGLVQRGMDPAEVERRVNNYLSMLNISHLANDNPNELSFGQKKMVAIAGVLAMETEVVVFDEPMAFLDPTGKKELQRVMQWLSDQGKTVVITTHDMQLVAEWAEDVIVMNEGSCLGLFSPSELFACREIMAQTKLELPPLAELALSMWDGDPLSMPIRLEEVKRWLQGRFEREFWTP